MSAGRGTAGLAAEAGGRPRSEAELIAGLSLEISAHAEEAAVERLKAHFAPGTHVYVSLVTGQDRRRAAALVGRLFEAGFTPVPHVRARSLESREAAQSFLGALVAAGAGRALLVAGDLSRARGPFSGSLDLLDSGLVEGSGMKAVGLAGYPEGHPLIAAPVLEEALVNKLAGGEARGLEPWIVSQFCFEAAPILAWLDRLSRLGIAAPVRIGLAGPADLATLARFAVRCGIGPSLRALTRRGRLWGRLVGYKGPERLIGELAAALKARSGPPVAGVHLFPFGGLERAGRWRRERLQGAQ